MNDFYNSTAWKSKRAAILSRDGYMCRECRRYGRQREATTVHHIKHYDEYPELGLDSDNLAFVKLVTTKCIQKRQIKATNQGEIIDIFKPRFCKILKNSLAPLLILNGYRLRRKRWQGLFIYTAEILKKGVNHA